MEGAVQDAEARGEARVRQADTERFELSYAQHAAHLEGWISAGGRRSGGKQTRGGAEVGAGSAAADWNRTPMASTAARAMWVASAARAARHR